MGAERARLVADLQGALMRAVGDFGGHDALAAQSTRVLATAAALDYVLMLASDTAGVRIARDDAERAIREGIVRAVDDLLACAGTIATLGTPEGSAFARETARALRDVLRRERLDTEERRFRLIALANA